MTEKGGDVACDEKHEWVKKMLKLRESEFTTTTSLS